MKPKRMSLMFIPGSPKLKIVHGTLKVFNKYLLNKRLPNNLIYCTLESVKKKKKSLNGKNVI